MKKKQQRETFGLYQVMLKIINHGVVATVLHGAVYEDEEDVVSAVQELNKVAKENDFNNLLYYVKIIKANKKNTNSIII